MKRLYLASSINKTAGHIAKDIGKKKLKLAFITTASEVEKGDKTWLKNDRKGFEEAGLDVFDYTLTGKTRKNLEQDLEKADVVHVCGGNTFYLLQKIMESGFDKWIREALSKGKIYIGSSAGSQVAGPDIEILRKPETKPYEKKLKTFEAIGLIDFIIFPHWGSVIFKDLYLGHRLKFSYKPKNKIILLNDWQYVKVEGDKYRIIDIRD